MVTATSVGQRIERWLESAQLMLGDLAEVADEWPRMTDDERASWSLDWDQIVASDLRVLERHYRSGTMTADQRARYRELQCSLRFAMPIVERLGLYPPPVLQARPARHANGSD